MALSFFKIFVEPSFASDKIYKYDYKATIYNTLEGQNTATSAFRMTAHLEISAEDGNKFVLKVSFLSKDASPANIVSV